MRVYHSIELFNSVPPTPDIELSTLLSRFSPPIVSYFQLELSQQDELSNQPTARSLTDVSYGTERALSCPPFLSTTALPAVALNGTLSRAAQ